MNITKSFLSYMHKTNENAECATLRRCLLIMEMQVEVIFLNRKSDHGEFACAFEAKHWTMGTMTHIKCLVTSVVHSRHSRNIFHHHHPRRKEGILE